MKLNSFRFKITILYVAILGVILIIYSAMLYLKLHYTLYDDLDEELRRKAGEVKKTISSYMDILGHDKESFIFSVNRVINLEGEHPSQNKIAEIENQWLQKIDKLDLREDYINFLSSDGKSIASSGNIGKDLHSVFAKNIKITKEEIFRNIKFKKNDIRIIGVPFSYEEEAQYIIEVGTSLKPIIYLLHDRLFNIAVSIPIVLLFAGFIGQLFAIRILKPVMEIAKTAENISHKDLSARIKNIHIDEEMKYLVNAFNDMISRLEASFKHIEEFSSHVAHELKTPLAIIKGESEVTLRKRRTLEEYETALKVNLTEVERMIKTIDDLLLIAKLDYRPEAFEFEDADLTEFCKEMCEYATILAHEKNICVNLHIPEDSVYVKADKLHLRRLFFNLIDNAVKFTPNDGGILIALKRKEKEATVSISDTGIGIKEEDMPKIFERFFHKNVTAEDATPGNGLGLSIACSIAKIHQGDIAVRSQPEKGTTFTVRLPIN